MKLKITQVAVFIALLLFVTGCSSVAFLAESEVAVIGRTAVGLEVTEAGLALTGESLFTSTISRALSISKNFGRITLTLSLEGLTVDLELLSPNVVRRVGTTEFITLPGKLAQIKSAKVQVKLNPSLNQPTVRNVDPDRPVLIMKDSIGWYKVRLEENKDGWVQKRYVEELYKTPEQILAEYSSQRIEREKPVSNCQTKRGNIVILMQNNKKMYYNDPHSVFNTFVIRLPKFQGATSNTDFYYSSFSTDVPITIYDIPEGVYTYEVKAFASTGFQGWHPNNSTKAAGTINVVGCKDVQLALVK